MQDRVRLPEDVRWDASCHCLEDVTLGTRHDVNASAGFVVGHLADGGWTMGELATLLADRYGLEEEQARVDTLELLATLDDEALVAVRRPARLRWSPAGVVTAVVGAVLGGDVFLARRLPATVGGVLRATALVMFWPSFVLLLAAAGLIIALQQVAPDGDTLLASSAGLVLALLACLWLTMAAHELGHLLALRRVRHRSVLVVRGWRMALLHAADAQVDPVRVALSGPLGGLAAGLVAATAGLVDPFGRELAVACAAVGLSHLVHLGPWAADGTMLWRAVAERWRSSRVVG